MSLRHYRDFFRQILEGENLSDKLLDANELDWSDFKEHLATTPGRVAKLKFSKDKVKFPKVESLINTDKRSMAIHFFANHELMAIEIMAYVILKFPHFSDEDLRLKKAIWNTLKDEQKHFKMYQLRIKENGVEFGDLPVNDFFWKQVHLIQTPLDYFAIMPMTFEMANLDFMKFYGEVFLRFDDQKTSQVLNTICEDEISHVALGVNWLNRLRETKTLWEYYCEILPWPITPARSKGQIINFDARLKTGIDDVFLKQAETFNDFYKPTTRKEWNQK